MVLLWLPIPTEFDLLCITDTPEKPEFSDFSIEREQTHKVTEPYSVSGNIVRGVRELT